MAYSITDVSQGSVILSPSTPAKPNSSWDILKSSPKTVIPRDAMGTSNLAPSAVYTTQWPLPATDKHDVPHDPPDSSVDVDGDQANYTRRRHQGLFMHVLQKLQTTNLVAGSDSRHRTARVVARRHHRAQQCTLDLGGGLSPEQAHGILHHCSITGQWDLAIARKAKLLLGHPQELAECGCAEVLQWDLKTPPIGRVHDTVALGWYRTVAVLIFFG